jgi:MerR family transcriptional regulator, light-induced transcriptional regulator
VTATGAAGREPVFTVGGAARRLGVPAATLRTWDRRHGIGPSGRSPGGHRRYTTSDLVRIRAMRALVETGVPAAEAAALAALSAQAGPAGPAGPAVVPVITPSLVIRAADALDAPQLFAMLSQAFAEHGVTAGWQQVAVPALAEFGRRAPHAAGHGAAEHLLSGILLATLLRVISRAPAARTARPVLLACAAEEQHVLPVYAVQAELAGRGVDIRQLGSRVPWPALAHAARRLQPAAVFVWAQTRQTADLSRLDGLPAGPRLVIGGPGWPPGLSPAIRVRSLDGAADLLAACAVAAS